MYLLLLAFFRLLLLLSFPDELATGFVDLCGDAKVEGAIDE
jgi:hypothetical protein